MHSERQQAERGVWWTAGTASTHLESCLHSRACRPQALVGIFNNRASNPVIQAAAADSTEAILWEVSRCGPH